MPRTKSTTQLSPQREEFAREYVRIGNGARAYRKAYNVKPGTLPDTIWQAASRLVHDSKVAARIAELQAQAAEKAVLSAADSIRDLTQTRTLAMELEMPSAAVSAATQRAKIAGHLREKVEHSGPGESAIHMVVEEVTIEDRGRLDFARRVAMLLAKGRKMKTISAE